MSNYIPVEGNSDLVRDPNTDQIINTNESAYQQYITRRQKRRSEKEKALTVDLISPNSLFKLARSCSTWHIVNLRTINMDRGIV